MQSAKDTILKRYTVRTIISEDPIVERYDLQKLFVRTVRSCQMIFKRYTYVRTVRSCNQIPVRTGTTMLKDTILLLQKNSILERYDLQKIQSRRNDLTVRIKRYDRSKDTTTHYDHFKRYTIWQKIPVRSSKKITTSKDTVHITFFRLCRSDIQQAQATSIMCRGSMGALATK